MNNKRAILLINLGGPEKLEEVKDFLFRLFADPEIIRVQFKPLRLFIAWLISTTREKKSQGLYRQIGGGSPIRKLTDQQANLLEKKLSERGKMTLVRTAFSCSAPLIPDVVKELYGTGVREFLSFPQYPQYSYTTSKSGLDQARDAVKKWAPEAKLVEIGSWPTHPDFIEAHVDLIQKEFKKVKDQNQLNTTLVFSAHSIPEKLVTVEKDPYKKEMFETCKAVVEKLQWKGPWILAWQSKLGPVKWLSPSTADTVVRIGKKGGKKVILDPIAFTTDHIETLEELDKEIAGLARENGVEEFYRVPGLNDHPKFIDALVDIASAQADFWK